MGILLENFAAIRFTFRNDPTFLTIHRAPSDEESGAASETEAEKKREAMIAARAEMSIGLFRNKNVLAIGVRARAEITVRKMAEKKRVPLCAPDGD
jgi:hypothetical protein